MTHGEWMKACHGALAKELSGDLPVRTTENEKAREIAKAAAIQSPPADNTLNAHRQTFATMRKLANEEWHREQ